jgi:uncharacterized protein YbcI
MKSRRPKNAIEASIIQVESSEWRYGVKVARLVLALLPRARAYPEDEREGGMPAAEVPLTGDELLAAMTEVMVAFHQRYHHRKPVTAKTLLLGDDLLACVLGGVYTDVEKTMIEIQRSTMVKETRNAFQNAMQDKFIKAVQRLSGRHVLAFFSNHHVGPDIEIELFLLTTNGATEQDLFSTPREALQDQKTPGRDGKTQ